MQPIDSLWSGAQLDDPAVAGWDNTGKDTRAFLFQVNICSAFSKANITELSAI